jgi:2-amino-4-hydroxy-6-hydroxymethyldihydropteridine diphosphokinase
MHLSKAIQILKKQARVTGISNAWETQAVGAPGDPNFLNLCVSLQTDYSPSELTEKLIRPIEASLGRTRTEDKNSPRPIDIDIILYDGQPLRLEYWDEAFMIVPLAELLPRFAHPVTGLSLSSVAESARKREWIFQRPEVLQGL